MPLQDHRVQGDMTLCQIRDCSARLIQGPLVAWSVNANYNYMNMWHSTFKPNMLIGFSLIEIQTVKDLDLQVASDPCVTLWL